MGQCTGYLRKPGTDSIRPGETSHTDPSDSATTANLKLVLSRPMRCRSRVRMHEQNISTVIVLNTEPTPPTAFPSEVRPAVTGLSHLGQQTSTSHNFESQVEVTYAHSTQSRSNTECF